MRHTKLRHFLIATGAVLAIGVIGLWSWNTLAGLFDAPTAQYKHALAVLALLAIVRIAVLPRRRERKIGTDHGLVR